LSLVVPRKSHRLWRVAAPLVVVAATTTGCFGGGSGAGDATALLQRVNEVRATAGLPALGWCGTLASAATAHATDMSVTGVHGHIGSNGSTFDQRAAAHGYGARGQWTLLAENVAWGQTGVDQVLHDWLVSPGHAANILNAGLQHAGFARVGTSWVQMFGAGGSC